MSFYYFVCILSRDGVKFKLKIYFHNNFSNEVMSRRGCRALVA
ncbi:hypothetical protein EMIT074MI3_20922 [Bacillus licheniformis]